MNGKQTRHNTFRQILRYVLGYKACLVGSLLLCLLQVTGVLLVPVLTGQVIDAMVSGGFADFALIKRLLLQIALVVGLSAVAQWLMGLVNYRMAYGTARDLRVTAFNHLQKMPLSVLDRQQIGDLSSRVIADVEQFADGLLIGFTQLFASVLTILGILFFMFRIHLVIAAVVVLVTPASLWLASFIAKRSYALFLAQSKARGEQTALVDEMIAGQKVVQAFSQEAQAQKRFDDINNRMASVSFKAIFVSSIAFPGTRFINALVYTAVGTVGAFFAITSGGISIGQLASFLSYVNQYTKPFNEISGMVTELQNAFACARRVFELLEMPTEEPDIEPHEVLDAVDGTVSLSDVSFSYTPEQTLIEGLNLRVLPGQRVAIVGPTGCGKTTLINLLMRFYDVNTGEIRVSKHEIRRLTRQSLRAAYGMVLQETWLKTGTVRENLCMGAQDVTEEQMIAAAKATHAHSFIKRMQDGYDTVLAEDGGSLSQGEKQLLCITRVMLKQPPMLILDEATSSIDTRTERYVQEAFAKMMEGRTSFIVAHRLSTVQNADVILVMKQGNIVEQGTHQELLAQKGFYAELYQSQFAM